MELRWTAGVVDVRCPVCGRSHGQELLATTDVHWREEPAEIVRCGDCGSVVISTVQPPSTYSVSDWDWYVEQIAGIEAIAGMLAKVGAPSGARMLDVGCGYGFGLDLAQVLYGWEGIGLDPSLAAERGRADLGLDIRPGTLDDAFEPDERFDVIFASEVLEHVPDPRSFLVSVQRRLSDTGVFLMTTPDAGCVHPETPMTSLYPALSIGAHEFLLTAAGLESMLRDAGLESDVWVEGVTICALAARSHDALRPTRRSGTVSPSELIRYCDERAVKAEPGSALSVGMPSRRLKFAVNSGEYEVAATGVPQLREAVLARHGVDLDDPSSSLAVATQRTSLVSIHYFLGILALNHDGDPKAAAAHFAASGAIGAALYAANGEYWDPETPSFEFLSFAHRAICLARYAPDEVPAALAQMDESVARGAGDAVLADEYRARIEREVHGRGSKLGVRRLQARAGAARAYRSLERSKVPGVSAAARGVRNAIVKP